MLIVIARLFSTELTLLLTTYESLYVNNNKFSCQHFGFHQFENDTIAILYAFTSVIEEFLTFKTHYFFSTVAFTMFCIALELLPF